MAEGLPVEMLRGRQGREKVPGADHPKKCRSSLGPQGHPGGRQVLTSSSYRGRPGPSGPWSGLDGQGEHWVQNSLAPVRQRAAFTIAAPILHMEKLSPREDRNTPLVYL